MDLPLILHIETSSELCSVSVAAGEEQLAARTGNGQRDHASQLTPLIADTLKDAGLTPAQLSAVALSAGPGSYTGLRIGTSTAKGICHALHIPLIAINTLEVLAAGMIGADTESSDLFCPLIDARRMEVYMAVYDRNLSAVVKPTPVVVKDQLLTDIDAGTRICIGGSGAQKCIPFLHKVDFRMSGVVLPMATMMHVLAFEKWQKRDFADIAYFEPEYLKEFYTPPAKKKSSF
ncbi:MAG: tRNA (adenosine(37)-N6)-threonylcarbamoyltransferase complex dimerization subunit type 1 TsaB [Chitinophagales bacterium]